MDHEHDPPSDAARIIELEAEVLRLEHEVETLREALESRTVIARATGLLAAGLQRPVDDAWAVLRRTSSYANVKLRDISRLLILAHDGRPAPGEEELAAKVASALGRASGRDDTPIGLP